MSATILIVDDLQANRRLLAAKLESEYYQTRTAGSGAEAIASLAEAPADLVLLDVMMPGMDGYEVCGRIKSDPRFAHVPVVMVTALNDQADRIRGLEAGADDFVSKPFDDDALFARIRSLLRFKMMTDELRLRDRADAPEVVDQPGDLLLIESSRLSRERLAGWLRERGHAVRVANDGAEAHAEARRHRPELVLVGRCGGADPLRTLSRLQTGALDRNTPAIVVLEDSDPGAVSQALDFGATDYVVRPADRSETLARVRTQLRWRRYHLRLRQRLREGIEMAYADALTGLPNRRVLDNHLARHVEAAREAGGRLSCAMIDVDRFKNFNDRHGHAAGDLVLKRVAATLAENSRGVDLVGRLGGEEFMAIMPRTDAEDASAAAERLRAAVAAAAVEHDGVALQVTASFGVAELQPDEEPDALVARADAALYAAKRAGRNRVRVAEHGPLRAAV